MGMMRALGIFVVIAVNAIPSLAVPAAENTTSSLTTTQMPCTTGEPVTTASYPISYAPVKPTGTLQQAGYQLPDDWHAIATFTFGVPTPIETGFAYAQFKCQFTCNAAPASSFFVKYAGAGNQIGSYCYCYDRLIDPGSFVVGNETWVGAWNSICR